eukprot:6474438-Amphidinium_carterae.1
MFAPLRASSRSDFAELHATLESFGLELVSIFSEIVPSMSHSTPEEPVQCPICLDTITDKIELPCRHLIGPLENHLKRPLHRVVARRNLWSILSKMVASKTRPVVWEQSSFADYIASGTEGQEHRAQSVQHGHGNYRYQKYLWELVYFICR